MISSALRAASVLPVPISCTRSLSHRLNIQNNKRLQLSTHRGRVASRSIFRHNCTVAYDGMHVPSDSFGGVSPERKAGEILRTFFTFTAVKIIMAQMEGVGRGDLGSYNASAYTTLAAFIQENPLRSNGDAWLAKLMERDEMLAVRIMEVRTAYMQKDFEWENCKRVAIDDTNAANVKLMRQHAQSKFAGLLQSDGEGAGDEGDNSTES